MIVSMKITDDILACEERKFAAIKDCLTEKGRRLWTVSDEQIATFIQIRLKYDSIFTT